MRYFDFHTHAFTDTLAERAMSSLKRTAEMSNIAEIKAFSVSHYSIFRQEDTSAHCIKRLHGFGSVIPCTDGTVSSLLDVMAVCNVNKSLILPIATKPSQQVTINNWVSGIVSENICACGTVHPDSGDILTELERIKSLGLAGVKFHPEYQRFRPDEERMFPIYEKIAELGMFVIFHGGYDPASTGEILATPESFANIARLFPGLTIVVAHMGGMLLFDDVEKYLAGKFRNVWFDTAMLSGYIDREQMFRIMKTHGIDRILFGSDAPWDNPQNEIDLINSLPLEYSEKEEIFYKNAERLISNE